ncbi:glycosyltransferase family A protein [Paenibacillus qinlingensis]|uniref:Glycosyltransferase involved in cell wall biosynthesis n=1 Tax=Paenibacillus qinlingensis TaxID=1837343 RepID=A0ABU1NT99_9BACL|nr:glycosyltransferase family A protein [Paenibacillus qinlingensis]MDR6550710.1 glycosyltransferase involved in cell wall biosynthesis [Paenibacillus qinlingensis]
MKASLIIPSYNAKHRLYLNLVSLSYQDYPLQDFEVVVVDNGSTDDTADMLSKFEANFPLITVRIEQNKGIAHGRNQGILKAVGDILIFHDSDMIASQDYVRKHIEAHRITNKVVCGLCWRRIYSYYYKSFKSFHQQLFKKLNNTYPEIQRVNDQIYQLITEKQIKDGSFMNYSFDFDNLLLFSYLKDTVQTYGENLRGYHFPWRYFLTNNASVERKRVVELGLFDENNPNWGFEDFDLGYRLYKSGSEFTVKHDIVSAHQEHERNYTTKEIKLSTDYWFEKYNDIHSIDMLLSLLFDISAIFPPMQPIIDPSHLNELMEEINEMQKPADYQDHLELFREMLQHAKNTYLNHRELELTPIHSDACYDMVNELNEKYGMIRFSEALSTLHQYILKT